MRVRWKILAAALCATMTTAVVNAAEIAFSAPGDFTEIGLNIKDTYSANPDVITLEVTLSQDAQQRMAAASGSALGQDLTLIINGKAVSTSRVQSVLDTPQLAISMSRQTAAELLPVLLGVNPGANPPAATQAAPVVAAAPVAIAAPAAPAAMLATDSVPLAATDEAPLPVSRPPPTPPAPLPLMPGWAQGSWLPTSATPSPFAEINAGDPITLFANAADAITCNKARFSVLESRDTRVRLQLAPNNQCVISGVQIDRLQISSTSTPGRIAISLYGRQDEFDGVPSKEGVYRRK
ncbi:hypothetical protein SAMN04515620_13057 [Collimonas sp. OK607]|uniref:hypothetical protein n=1 Tax=Collimonas sp. OK607 TaxID=1798194 RepID=UPI0008EAEC40|nr:hypothetical protein [Collimonas sp. OK607]SFB25066.1 hypothetical protein SAMN04515620_13057 [Collimonas sp. OK607]